jgi:hypothetical protein
MCAPQPLEFARLFTIDKCFMPGNNSVSKVQMAAELHRSTYIEVENGPAE